MEEIIEIEVTPKGVAKIEAFGFSGDSCKSATKPFEDIYSKEVSSSEKPEIHIGARASAKSNVSR